MKYIFMTIAIIILFGYTASAETLHPTVGQIQASGATPDDEFIVVQNPTAQSVDMSAWSIQYKSANGTTYYKKNFVKGASVAAGGTYVVCGKDYAGACDMKHSSFSLSSSGGTVFLVSNQVLLNANDAATVIDQATYAADAGTAKANDPAAPANSDIQTADTAVTPQTATAAAKPAETLLVTINEFMPAPVDGKEWIELYDGTGYAVDLANWTLADGTGKNFVTLDGLIMPNGFKLIELDSSHLNNSGDLITLRDANKNIIDEVAYGDWNNDPDDAPVGDDGVAIARIGDGRDTNDDAADFVLTATPTPGAANVISAPATNDQQLATKIQGNTQTQSSKIPKTDSQWLADLLKTQNDTIAKLLKADNIIIINNLTIETGATEPIKIATASATKPTTQKTTAKTSASTKTTPKTTVAKTTNTAAGMVIVAPGVVGKDVCVVREENSSIEVRLPKDLKTAPVAGDIVAASGAWSTAQTLTLPRLLVSKATAFAINDHDTPPEPISVPMSGLTDHLGELIATAGTIVEKQPTRLRIAEGDASLLIKTNFSAAKGDKLSATGLLVKGGPDLQLTALAPDALSIIKPPSLAAPSLAQRSLPYGLAVLPAGILSTAVYFGKRLKKKGGEAK
jgi:hypothetical protein